MTEFSFREQIPWPFASVSCFQSCASESVWLRFKRWAEDSKDTKSWFDFSQAAYGHQPLFPNQCEQNKTWACLVVALDMGERKLVTSKAIINWRCAAVSLLYFGLKLTKAVCLGFEWRPAAKDSWPVHRLCQVAKSSPNFNMDLVLTRSCLDRKIEGKQSINILRVKTSSQSSCYFIRRILSLESDHPSKRKLAMHWAQKTRISRHAMSSTKTWELTIFLQSSHCFWPAFTSYAHKSEQKEFSSCWWSSVHRLRRWWGQGPKPPRKLSVLCLT